VVVYAFALPFIGILWGILAGGAGRRHHFRRRSVFRRGSRSGQFGSVALPAFTGFSPACSERGDELDRKHFLPIAFGITFIISAFILGL
jgi:hypothetical protein